MSRVSQSVKSQPERRLIFTLQLCCPPWCLVLTPHIAARDSHHQQDGDPQHQVRDCQPAGPGQPGVASQDEQRLPPHHHHQPSQGAARRPPQERPRPQWWPGGGPAVPDSLQHDQRSGHREEEQSGPGGGPGHAGGSLPGLHSHQAGPGPLQTRGQRAPDQCGQLERQSAPEGSVLQPRPDQLSPSEGQGGPGQAGTSPGPPAARTCQPAGAGEQEGEQSESQGELPHRWGPSLSYLSCSGGSGLLSLNLTFN